MRTVSADWVIPVEGEPIRDGAVVIGDDGRIASVGASADLGRGEHFADAVITPGFVNAHTHIEYATYAGFGDGQPFVPWIGLHIRRKDRLGLDEMRAIALVGAWECLRSGVTTIGDCSYSGAAGEAAAAVGLRATIYLEVFGADASALEQFFVHRDRIEPVLSDRVRVGISPHAPFTVSAELYAACHDLRLPMQTHIAESPAEREWLVHGTGDWSPLAEYLLPHPGRAGVAVLADAGVLGPELSIAHGVHLEPDEIATLAAHGVGIAHCPRSNGYLGCGIAPVAAFRAAGVAVGIATDSPASTPSLDLFEEARTALVAARAHAQSPEALSARDVLEAITLGGARVLGRADEIGSLVAGKQGDLTIVSLAGSPFLPMEDPVVAVVQGGSPDRVVATLVAGEDRYRRGLTEWPDSTRAARSAREHMLR